MERYYISFNEEPNQLMSDILVGIGEMFQNNSPRPYIEYTKSTVPMTKGGDMVIALTLSVTAGVVANLLTPIIKDVINRFRDRPDFDPDINIKINQNVITLNTVIKSDNKDLEMLIKSDNKTIEIKVK